MSYAIPIAIHNALNSARKNAGNNDVWYNRGRNEKYFQKLIIYYYFINMTYSILLKIFFSEYPLTIEKILLNSLTTKEQLVL